MNQTDTLLPIKACIFDMDGLLINTEQLYTEVTNELLARYNKPKLSIEVKTQIMGIPGLEATKILIKSYEIEESAEKLYKEAGELQKKKFLETKEMPGSYMVLKYLKDQGIPIVLATSSSIRNFHIKTNHLSHIFSHFGENIVRGDDPRIPKGRGKPAPDIYLTALNIINNERKSKSLEPITSKEYSILGVQAGRSAGMRVIWVPEPDILKYFEEKKEEIIGTNNEILSSLENFNPKKYGL
ncbi:hypothetical protein PNEG_02737 [Pneumocystis murina B123]|uniref:HAD hydrolase, family IA n=1 Tax=Pneumocystis murina (strain B123) TaxID=1069680 RepID=M7NK07_PNEMU|nr:hypothetical protein PNEG_02737 [Pneumocystis murina B123]EMR08958.1 hypothetical protein PNEG_02737 [Pneumocystis murina B123]